MCGAPGDRQGIGGGSPPTTAAGRGGMRVLCTCGVPTPTPSSTISAYCGWSLCASRAADEPLYAKPQVRWCERGGRPPLLDRTAIHCLVEGRYRCPVGALRMRAAATSPNL